ncbi:hypothetical protein KAOT1_15673 [Kordia algicida OT-1]|uniref:Uncharacterized protein n=1 Tax=Kordia algicida OT-1 TaxID=391587 RepID=A9DQB1_9FLAO|nr:hypothetical protein KAOT1_15673 [Kordia algicida OT-1]
MVVSVAKLIKYNYLNDFYFVFLFDVVLILKQIHKKGAKGSNQTPDTKHPIPKTYHIERSRDAKT